MDNGQTRRFTAEEHKELMVADTLIRVYDALAEKGYNPINQIVGYLLSEDPTYIPRHKDARKLIRQVERDEIMEILVRDYLEHHGVNIEE
ncbi:IreB family regulatory phosphoprotein [Catellicoccus marimammalium]|nr:IreB family regulatory phosphoprotein [Catellicoccus marimammalium]